MKPKIIPERKLSEEIFFLDKLLGSVWLSSHLWCGGIFPSKSWKSLQTSPEVN